MGDDWGRGSGCWLSSPARARAKWEGRGSFGRGEDRSVGPYDVAMDVQPITYRGRIVAACTCECFLLADDLAYRAPGDPELVFVVAMCSYASDIAQGLLPGPLRTPTRIATRAPS
jgi:hypothetical protein